MWQQQRTMKDLDLALRETQSRWIRVERARKSVPTNNGEFAARVAALKQRIDALQVRLADVEEKQSGYLAQLAVQALDAQKSRLAAYQVQARFALATMYDRAANSDITHTQQGVAPQQKDGAGRRLPGRAAPARTGARSRSRRARRRPAAPPPQSPPAASDSDAPAARAAVIARHALARGGRWRCCCLCRASRPRRTPRRPSRISSRVR